MSIIFFNTFKDAMIQKWNMLKQVKGILSLKIFLNSLLNIYTLRVSSHDMWFYNKST